MGYIDSDAHAIECDHTWDFFDPSEEHLRPTVTGTRWAIQDQNVDWPGPVVSHWMNDIFPPGSVDLSDPAARIKYMDELGVDVHVMYPTFSLIHYISNPLIEAAMARSYNRWIAEATSDSGGRLGWAIFPPVRMMDRCLEELEFGKANGAMAVFLLGENYGMSLSDPYLAPFFAKAQDLDLPIAVHVGGDRRVVVRQPGLFLHSSIMPVPGAFWSVLSGSMPKKYPGLRWAFLEAGAGWLPWVLQENFRADDSGALVRSFTDWRVSAMEALEEQQLYVAVQMDDDLPYLLEFAGQNRLVHGTDFGHLDVGSDPNGLHIVAGRTDIDPANARRIVDDNGRLLYGIDPDFCPAPPASREGLVLEPGAAKAH